MEDLEENFTRVNGMKDFCWTKRKRAALHWKNNPLLQGDYDPLSTKPFVELWRPESNKKMTDWFHLPSNSKPAQWAGPALLPEDHSSNAPTVESMAGTQRAPPFTGFQTNAARAVVVLNALHPETEPPQGSHRLRLPLHQDAQNDGQALPSRFFPEPGLLCLLKPCQGPRAHYFLRGQ